MKKSTKYISTILIVIMILEVFSCVPTFALSDHKEQHKYDVSEIIVKYKSLNNISSETKNVKEKYVLKKRLNSSKIEVIDVLSTDKMADAISRLSKDPNVEYVVPNNKITTYGFSDEPLFEQQIELTKEFLNIPSAWDYSSGENVIVGVLDTGIHIFQITRLIYQSN